MQVIDEHDFQFYAKLTGDIYVDSDVLVVVFVEMAK